MSRFRTICTAVMATLLAGTAMAQDLVHKPGPQTTPVLLVGATVHPVSSEPIEGGAVYFDDGVIRAVMTADEAERWRRSPSRPDDLEVQDLTGLHVYPGLVSGNTVLGLMEIGDVDVTNDTNEYGQVTPEARAVSSVNPDSTLIPVTRRAGILTAGVLPSGGAVPGRAAVIRLEGWTWEDMAIKPDAGLVVSWPNLRVSTAWWVSRTPEEQREQAQENRRRIIDLFDAAEAYFDARAADPAGTRIDTRYEALRPSLSGAAPVFVRAQELEQIMDAVTVCSSYGMRVVIVGGRDAEQCAEHLKAHDAAVMITGTHRMPRRADSPYDDAFTLPARLEAAGVRWSLATGGGVFQTPHERSLPHHAATAVAYGLDHAAGLRAITLSAAEVLGVGRYVGSIEPGKLASVIVTDGDPLEITTNVLGAYISGRSVDLSSKQTELYEKYRKKYQQLGIID